MTDELPPVRCVTCNKMLANKWQTYQNMLSRGVSIEDALNKLGLTRYCCKIRMTNPFKVVERAVQNDQSGSIKSFEDNFDSLSISLDSEAPSTGALSAMTNVTSMTIIPETEQDEIQLPSLPSNLPSLSSASAGKTYRVYKSW